METNHKEEIKKLGVRIRLRRAELEVTQEELAERIGCHFNTISRIDRGLVDPSFVMIIRIARALEMSPQELLPKK